MLVAFSPACLLVAALWPVEATVCWYCMKCWTWHSPALYRYKKKSACICSTLESVPEPSVQHARSRPGLGPETFLLQTPHPLCYLWRVTCHHECHMLVEEAELGRPVVSVLLDNSLWFPVVERSSMLQASAHCPAHPSPPCCQPYMYEWMLFFCWTRCCFPPKEVCAG